MGNGGSRGSRSRRRSSTPADGHDPSLSFPGPPPPEIDGNRYVFPVSTPFPGQYPNPPQYYPYSSYLHPPMSRHHVLLPAPSDHHHRISGAGGYHAVNYPCGTVPMSPAPLVERQKAVTIRNNVNIRKETLKVEPDEENPGQHLVTFTFDAMVDGSVTVIFFAKEDVDFNLITTKESLNPVTVSFKQGLGQKFRQPSGTGINFSAFVESELLNEGDMKVFPLVVKAEASSSEDNGLLGEGLTPETRNSQITQALFEMEEKDKYQVKIVKQILWVNGTRYELQEIYGIGNSIDSKSDENELGKECVICLTEPRDTTVLPCRHMCMCSGCARVLRFQTSQCPICRQPIERLLEIEVNDRPKDVVLGCRIKKATASLIYQLYSSTEAVDKIYEIKGRKQTSPLAICVADVPDIKHYGVTDDLPPGLLDDLLPGPVTVVLKRGDSSILEKSLNPGLDTIGIRVPDNNFIRLIARGSESALALTSANLSGQPSSVKINDFESLWQHCAYVYDGGLLPSGQAGSTIVDLTKAGMYKILRPGSAMEETLSALERFNLEKSS